MGRTSIEELVKLAEIDQNFGASLATVGELSQLAETGPTGNRSWIEIYGNMKAYFGTPVFVRGEVVAVLSIIDRELRPDWVPSMGVQLEEFARKVSVVLEAGPSADIADVLPADFLLDSAKEEQLKITASRQSTCSSSGFHDQLHALTHSQLAAVTKGAGPSYLAALSRMAGRQLSDIVMHKHSLDEDEASALRHSLDIAHLRHLGELGNSDDHVIHALESIAALQRDAVCSLAKARKGPDSFAL